MSSFDNIAKEATIATNTKFDRGDDLSDLLNQYQDYTDQRLAIERKFNEDIATLQEQRKQATKNGDTNQVEQIDRSIAQATKNKGMELMKLDYDKLKESPEYVRAFENLKETSSETLNSLLTQLENARVQRHKFYLLINFANIRVQFNPSWTNWIPVIRFSHYLIRRKN